MSKVMEDFNTKYYVMNNEGKLFQQKQSLETLFLLMKKTRAKKFKVRMFYHLQILFWGVLSGGFCRGVYVRGEAGGGEVVLIPANSKGQIFQIIICKYPD